MSFVLKNAGISFIPSSSSLGKNLPLQNHLFGENRGKCNQACELKNGVFSFFKNKFLMRHKSHNVLVADRSY
jgi:hypothetical protein